MMLRGGGAENLENKEAKWNGLSFAEFARKNGVNQLKRGKIVAIARWMKKKLVFCVALDPVFDRGKSHMVVLEIFRSSEEFEGKNRRTINPNSTETLSKFG